MLDLNLLYVLSKITSSDLMTINCSTVFVLSVIFFDLSVYQLCTFS